MMSIKQYRGNQSSEPVKGEGRGGLSQTTIKKQPENKTRWTTHSYNNHVIVLGPMRTTLLPSMKQQAPGGRRREKNMAKRGGIGYKSE